MHPFVEADQPQTPSAPRLGEIEALPVVCDGQLQASGGASQHDVRLARACMRGDIAQRFLSDAVQTERHVLRNVVKTAGSRKCDLDRALPSKLGAMTFERSDQAGVLYTPGCNSCDRLRITSARSMVRCCSRVSSS